MTELDDQLESLKGATIMLVDDEPTTVEMLEVFLEGEGYGQVIGVTDSRRVLETLAAEAADVLLLDLHMPHIDGFEILERIRSDSKLSRVPVIMLTAATDADTKLKALELGVTDFLNKPVDPSELALRLRNTLSAKAYQDRLTEYDGVTGLPNRRVFLERADRALQRTGGVRSASALLHVKLDGFQRVNETLGHLVGDALLRAVARRLTVVAFGRASSSPQLSRVGGEEFALFLPALPSPDEASDLAKRVLASLAKPYRSPSREVFLASRVGIAFSPEHGAQPETLLRHARMCSARRSARNGFSVFDQELATEAARRFQLETDIRGAVTRGEMELHYQPRVDVGAGQITGVEALMRWHHPRLGLVTPGEFVPIAEEMHVIDDLGRWAIRGACCQAREWQRAGLPPLLVSVNVSAQQLGHGDLVETLRAALDESGLDPGFLLLELTEAQLMTDPEAAAELLQRVAEMNLSISVDHFGTGYSALGNLKQFPVDELKIDRSFVGCLPDDSDTAAIVKAIVAMAHTLGLSVVAEGVEDERQLALLRSIGCDEYQGFLCSEALPAREVAKLFTR